MQNQTGQIIDFTGQHSTPDKFNGAIEVCPDCGKRGLRNSWKERAMLVSGFTHIGFINRWGMLQVHPTGQICFIKS